MLGPWLDADDHIHNDNLADSKKEVYPFLSTSREGGGVPLFSIVKEEGCTPFRHPLFWK